MRKPRTLGLVLLLGTLAACRAREALVVFDVTVDSRALGYTDVQFSADVVGAGTKRVPAPETPERFRFGYYLPASAVPVRIEAQAHRGSDCVLGRGAITVSRLEAGATTKGADLAIRFEPTGRCEQDAGPPAEPSAEAGPPPIDDAGDREPPVVLGFTPAEGGERVDRGAVIEVSFSEPIMEVGLAAAVKVTTGTTEVAGRITLAGGGKLLRFSPAAKLPMATTVTTTLASTVRDLAGNQLAAPVSASFVTADGGWTEPVLIDQIDNFGLPGLPDTVALAVNRRGEAMVAWLRFSTETRAGGVLTSVYANRFTPETGWSKTGVAADNPSGQVTAPRLALDDEGRALLVTDQRRTGTDAVDGHVVMASQFDPIKGWSFSPFPLNGNRPIGNAWGSNVAMAPNGDAIATWSFDELGGPSAYALRYLQGRWSTITTRLDRAMPMQPPPLSAGVAGLVAALAQDGVGIALWAHEVRTAASVAQAAIWANRGTPLEGWGEPARLSTDTEAITRKPALAIDAEGNAVAAWGQQNADAMTSFVFTSLRAATRTWARPTVVGRESSIGGPDMARALAMNDRGTAILAFSETGQDISVTRIADGAAAPLRATKRSRRVSDIAVGIDAAGQAIAVWSEEAVMVARERGGGLELPVQIGGPSPTGPHRLRVLPDGRAFLVWVEGQRPHRLMGARFE